MAPKVYGPMTKQQSDNRDAKIARRAAAKQQKQGPRKGPLRTGKQLQTFSMQSDPASRAYMAALNAPFSSEANGARVPEPFAVSTKANHNTTLYTVTAGNGGGASLVVLPNPITTVMWQTASTVVSGGVDPNLYQLPATTGLAGNVGANILDASMSTYRVVGMGVRIKPNVSYTSAQGKFIVAMIPSVSQAPFAANSGTTWAALCDAYGWPATAGYLSPSILSFDKSMEISHSELLTHGGLEINVPITSGDAWRFKSSTYATATIGGASYTFPGTSCLPGISVETTNLTTGIATPSGLVTDVDAGSLGGFSTVGIFAEGLGAATTFTVEIVMHLEGTPATTSVSTSGVLMDDSLKAARSAPNANVVVAQRAAMRNPFTFVDVIEEAQKQFSRIGKQAIGTLAGKVMGMMV